MAFLAQVKQAKMRAFVAPGQSLRTEARLLHDGSGYAVAAGRILSDGKPVAEAEITYRVMPFPNETLRQELLKMARRVAVPAECFDE
jgi:3-hydroxyacyl-[acyl-carrier-protein] dehydratase